MFYLEEGRKQEKGKGNTCGFGLSSTDSSFSQPSVVSCLPWDPTFPITQLTWVKTKATSGSKFAYKSASYISFVKVIGLKIDLLPNHRQWP